MDPKPDEGSTFNSGSKQHVLKKILYDKNAKKKASSASSSTSKKSDESKKTSPDSAEKSSEGGNIERPSSRSSPDPNCAICLEPLQNKSFTDSCFHTFCFTCLLEWSKVKPECPLCKQQFKSIVHNVQKDLSFDEYVIGSRTSLFKISRARTYFTSDPQRFRYPTTMTTARLLERSRATYQESYQSQIASHRMRFAPHSVNMYSSAQIMSRLPCPFRRRVYEQNLWVKTSLNGRTRLANPEFYKRNPACTHRLIPWLNRELVSLWQDNEAHVSFVLELIMSLVVRYHINSQEFLIHIEPYMGRNTHHFIHEFHAFAISPYDMENYDAHADYGLIPHSTDDAERSSPDSDIIAVFSDETTPLPRQNRERKQNMRQQALKHLTMILKKSGGNSWESYLSPSSSFLSTSNWSNPGPSTSGFRESNFLPVDGNASTFASVSDTEQTDDDDEIQVVDVVKPRAERTPEIVDLSSDEEMPVTVIDVSSGEENFSPVRMTPSPARMTMTSPLNLSINDRSSDIECILECQPSSSRDIPTTNEVSAEKETKVEKEQEQKESHHSSSATEELDSDFQTEVKKTPKLASAIVRPWTTESESSSKAWVPEIKERLTPSYVDDTLSENSDVERRSSPKRLKLQSVVACWSLEGGGCRHESSHRSSHKKRKEKKKKKRKHSHRHKHRIYSDSDSA